MSITVNYATRQIQNSTDTLLDRFLPAGAFSTVKKPVMHVCPGSVAIAGAESAL